MKIAVLFGGTSDERDVSIGSGMQVVGALRERDHDVLAVDTARGVLDETQEAELRTESGVGSLPPERKGLDMMSTGDPTAMTRDERFEGTDIIFVALHGGAGEDGTMQALLDLVGVPYTGSGHLGSALAMDKQVSKVLFREAGVPTPDWLMAPATIEEVRERLGLPVIVKASKQGSTVGLSVVKEPDALGAAIEEGFRYDDEVVIERFTPGRELTVGILGDEALPVGEIIPEHEIFDYECKYQPGMAQEIFPADLESRLASEVQRLALVAHRALKLRNYSRIDFMMDDDGGFWCLEANTAPGMTEASLMPKAGRAAGFEFPELCEKICELALDAHSDDGHTG